MTESTLATIDETPTNEKRHPWRCTWKLYTEGKLAHTCNTINRARDSHCQRCGRPYVQETRTDRDPGRTLTEAVSLSAAVQEWAELRDTVRSLFAQMHAIEERAGVLFLDQDAESIRELSLHSHRSHHVDYSRPDDVIEEAERTIWGAIVARSGILRIISSKRANEIDRDLSSGELPELSPKAVQEWLANAQGSFDELLREKIDEVFRWLRPATSYKTNQPFEIGRKVVLEYMVEKADPRWGWSVRINHHMDQMLTSIETLFRTLDGKGGATVGWKSDLRKAIEEALPDDPRFETEYFRGKVFRNGNMHLEFRRMDLVAKLNAVAGGKNLRGERAK